MVINNFKKDTDSFPEVWWDIHTSWEAYNRYMTALQCWAEQIGWTTTQLENTIFEEYYPG